MTTLLIVDDLAQNRYLLETLFQGLGYRVLSAENGAVALALAQSEHLDLVISDILMPVMDGFELCRRLKTDEHLKTIPFIIYTATYTEPKDERFALSLGADRFLTKPQEPEALLSVIREVLNEGPVQQALTLDGSLDAEMEYLRQHSETLFTKLDKKVRDLQRLSDLHLLLYQINLAIRSATSEAELFREVCRLCVEQGNFDLAWIGWVPLPGSPLRVDFVAGPLAGYAQGLEIPLDPALPTGQGPSAACLREDRIIVCQDWASDPSVAPWAARAEPYGIHSSASLPVSLAGRAVAILNLHSSQPWFFTQDRLDLIEELAKDLSYAIGSLAQTRQRREAEKALAAREMEYRAAFEQGVVGLAQVSLEGRFLEVNRRFCEILGYEAEAVIGHHFQEFTHPDDKNLSLSSLQAAVTPPEGRYHFQKRYLRKDGQVVWVNLSGGPVRDPGGQVLYLLSTFEDITQQKAYELQIQAERTRLQTLIQTIPDLVWLKDLNGVYQFSNPRFEAFVGATKTDLLGKTDYDFVDKELADWFREHDRLALEAGGPSLNEEWVTFADGHRELLETIKTPVKDASGQPVGVLGIARDVTQSRKDQDRLRKLSKAIEQSPVVVVITDRAGIIEYVNPRFTELTGYLPAEAVGANPRLLKSGTTPPEVYAGLWDTILAGRVWLGELQNRKKSGELFWESVSIAPILDEAGTITHFVALEEDITNMKRVHTELQEQLLELRRWHEATLGRETRVLELKGEVNELLARLGQTPRYQSVESDEPGTAP
jgi:PAS domain S-box-containing protein